VTTAFVEGQKLGAYTSFVDLAKTRPDVTRKILISGGFLNNKATSADPKAFVYAFDSAAFPNMPLIQPRLGSVEEWKFINHNNDEHPIHVHVNDFQVVDYFDPTTGVHTGPDHFAADNSNAPAPIMQIDESVIQPGILSIRTRFDDYIGLFVMHCHRLNHEDNGLMALINVIPAVSSYAAAVAGGAGKPTEVRLFDGKDDRQIATVVPFPGYEGAVSIAMGDIDGDAVLDLVVGAGKDHAPEVVVYSGKHKAAKPFETELARFQAFPSEMRGGVSVTATQIDGTTSDNIVVGSGPGSPSEVRVYGTSLPASPGVAPPLFSSFKPNADDTSGVKLAAGFVDFSTGRNSLVTASGPGSIATVKVFVFPLTTPIAHGDGQKTPIDKPVNTTSFLPFGAEYRGGVSIGTGWLAGSLGGAKRIIVSQLADKGAVKVYSSGSALDGGPAMYLESPAGHDHGATFREIASFEPFAGASGAQVATTSTPTGANLLVSGTSTQGARVLKFDFVRASPKATVLQPKPLGEILSLDGARLVVVGGD
jgi:Multicopper oxidase